MAFQDWAPPWERRLPQRFLPSPPGLLYPLHLLSLDPSLTHPYLFRLQGRCCSWVWGFGVLQAALGDLAWPPERGRIIFRPSIEHENSSFSSQFEYAPRRLMHDVAHVFSFVLVEHHAEILIGEVAHTAQRLVRLSALE